jgi:cytochrome oxidase Cu insertion factor (SCO1/SenC/PrrC family)
MRRISVTKAAAAAFLALSLLVGLGAAATACGTAAAGSSSGTPATSASKARPAPAFSGVTLAGKTVSLDQFRGKPLFIIYMTST